MHLLVASAAATLAAAAAAAVAGAGAARVPAHSLDNPLPEAAAGVGHGGMIEIGRTVATWQGG